VVGDPATPGPRATGPRALRRFTKICQVFRRTYKMLLILQTTNYSRGGGRGHDSF